ncbi:MAG TPA: hypothetical protein VF469_13395 [Kofleriaceae bacterium]
MVRSRGTARTAIAMAAVVLAVGATAAVASPDEHVGRAERAERTGRAERAAVEAPAMALPGAHGFVSGLDLECFDTPGPALNLQLQVAQLDPGLLELGLGRHDATVRELVQTCAPVQKNGASPHPAALPFLRQIGLACYRLDAAPLAASIPLRLGHLNPELATLPAYTVSLIQPVQLCVPVARNGAASAPDVRRLIQFIALECYAIDPGAQPSFGVRLEQLDPALADIPKHQTTLVPTPGQVCVAVRKNDQEIPADVLAIVRWIELERFTASPAVTVSPVASVLGHLDPLLTTLPRTQVVLQQASAVMTPVFEHGEAPPPP